MSVPAWVWAVTTAGLLLLVLADLVLGTRRRHAVTVVEASCWLGLYVGLAVLFGLGIWLFAGGTYAGEFFGGYITEYSLSVDNLFVFVIIMTSFKVPAIHQHRALLIGIVVALVLRAAFITAGIVAINALSWFFYLFAAFLIYTAINVVRQGVGNTEEEWTEPRAVGLVRRLYPTTERFYGSKMTVRINGKRWFTPMLIVTLAIGLTDLLFALDSIPAIFGITQHAFLVFTSNAFALMALRQLYFLLSKLLKKLVYLSYGLSAVLAFIGVKLFLHALHENELPILNDGKPIPVPEIGVSIALPVIVGILAITTIASLIAVRRNPALAAAAAEDEDTAAGHADRVASEPTFGK
ncbi:TerC/Alx family metal homeostasis membrane protein [Amycolatopsis taiwanensis]|uniref:Tellurium resistance protein TerC n=1 Tax=Amycolatopsis taiwanensis TaxID=342230 RepID=A0A9W6R7V3_9PSEU|nr:TerC/Alx family metal homeostasis membrane protein [Amycolatopsis taiwanensis]GLY69885.1 tellurium resistance protein TerC [Amycolatopsis taiwanensis]